MHGKAEPATRPAFSLHWGSGVIEEEVRVSTTYHRPTIQLKFTEGVAAGPREIRFRYYDHHGRFQPSPLIIDLRARRAPAFMPGAESALPGKAISHTPLEDV